MNDPATKIKRNDWLTKTDDAGVVTHRYGMPVPKTPRMQAILWSKRDHHFDDLRDSVVSGATFREAALEAGYTPKEFDYMMKLGEAGHPVYAGLFSDLARMHGEALRELREPRFMHALTDEGVKDGTNERFVEALERQSWLKDKGNKAEDVKVDIGLTVKVKKDFGNEVEIEDNAILEAEYEEVG
jgi:hypothetical protein